MIRYVAFTPDDRTKLEGIQAGAEVNPSASDIKTEYESNANTNAFEDLEKTKLTGIESLAEVNNISDLDAMALTGLVDTSLHYHSSDRDRDNHTGTQLANTISDFDTAVVNNPTVLASTIKLLGIESGAEVNQTDSEIKTQYENNADTNAFTDAEQTKLSNSLDTSQHRNTYGYDIHIDDTIKATAYDADDSVKTQLQNNAATEMSDLPPSVTHLIGPSGGALLDQVNAIYSIGIQFSAYPITRDKDYYLLFEIPDGVSPGVPLLISKRFQRFAKQLKDEVISMSFVLPCTASIVNKEILAYIETQDTDLEYWGTQMTVTKINGPIV